MVYQNGKAIAMSLTSEDAASQNIYSTEEQVTGRWIDGRPVYQRTFVSHMPDTVSSWYNVGRIKGIDMYIRIDCVAKNITEDKSSSSWYPIPTTNSDITSSCLVACREGDDGLISVFNSLKGFVSNPLIMIVEYVKTADIVENVAYSIPEAVSASASSAKIL